MQKLRSTGQSLRLKGLCAGLCLSFAAMPTWAQTVPTDGSMADPLRPTILGETAVDPLGSPSPFIETALLPPDVLLPPLDAVDLPLRRQPKLDPFTPLGLDIGGFRLYPTLAVGGTYSSNARQSSDRKIHAVGLHLRPSIRIVSEWLRHSFESETSGDVIKYFKKSIPTPYQFASVNKARLDIRRTTFAEFEGRYEQYRQGPDNSDTPRNARDDQVVHRGGVSAALIHDMGPAELRVKAEVRREVYEDVKLQGGGKERNKYRNFTAPLGSLRVTYTDPPVIKPFIEGEFSPRFHDKKRNAEGRRLDAHDTIAKLGAVIRDDPIWEGEAALVYAHRQFKDHSFKSENSFGVDARLRWAPNELTSVQLTLNSGLMDSSDAASDSGKTHRARLEITRQIRDNLTLLTGAAIRLDKLQGSGTDKTYHTNLGLEWEFNPNLAWTASYDGTWFNRYRSSDDYNEQRITTGFVLRR